MVNKQINESKAFAIASLVVGILGLILFLLPYLGLVLSVLAIVFSGISKKKLEQSGLNTAGMVLGIIGTIINALMLFLVILVILIS